MLLLLLWVETQLIGVSIPSPAIAFVCILVMKLIYLTQDILSYKSIGFFWFNFDFREVSKETLYLSQKISCKLTTLIVSKLKNAYKDATSTSRENLNSNSLNRRSWETNIHNYSVKKTSRLKKISVVVSPWDSPRTSV